jgi:hypothetical protein
MTPYAGASANYPQQVGTLDGATTPNATNINTAPQGVADRTAHLALRLMSLPALNWQPVFGPTQFSWQLINATGWDPFNKRWLLGAKINATDWEVSLVSGMNDLVNGEANVPLGTWTGGGSPTFTPSGGVFAFMSFAKDPRNANLFYAGAIHGGVAECYKCDTTAGNPQWTRSFHTLTTANSSIELLALSNGTIIAGFIDSADAASSLVSSPDSGATWNTVVASNDNEGPWWIRTNGTLVVAVCESSLAATVPKLYISADQGASFTLTSLGAIGIAAGDQARGLAWGCDATGPCWLLAILRAGGTQEIWRSPDAATWVRQNAMTTVALEDLISIGGPPGLCLFVGLVDESTTLRRVVYSTDGGVTFLNSPARHPWLSTDPNLPHAPKITASDTQLAIANVYGVRYSSALGPSTGAIP